MKVLIACEYSGTVRDAFALRGHDAWSCDIIPTESEMTKKEGKHIQGDVIEQLNKGWDMMIGHPPCTFISYAGVHVWNNPGRVFKRLEALMFFAKLWEAPIPKICLENPKSCASPVIAKYSQEIQPYYFGDEQLKTTWLWLKELPLLQHTKQDNLFEFATACDRPEPLTIDNTVRQKKRYFTDAATRNPKARAKFWPGIANAMVEQWG